MLSTSVNYDTIWREWLVDLALQPFPHCLNVERMRGYDGNCRRFRTALGMIEDAGWVSVHWHQDVSLTPQGLSIVMRHALGDRHFTWRELAREKLDPLGRDGLRDRLAPFFDSVMCGVTGLMDRDVADTPIDDFF